MTKQQLSDNEIDQLFRFVKSKYVRFIDVQYEIVDHLATQIEELLTEDPNLNFKTALSKVYSEYPITGFTRLLENKSKAMNDYWYTLIWSYIKEYLRLPKIILTFIMIGLYYQVFSLGGKYAITGIFTLLTICGLYQFFNGKFIKNKKVNDKYLVINSYNGTIGTLGFVLPQTLCQLTNFNYVDVSWVALLSLALLASIYSILLPALLFIFPEKLKSEIDNKYGHLSIKIA